jgi:hypothetical protein
MKYTGLEYKTCTSCHENLHVESNYSDCLRCHNQQGWRREALVFGHNDDTSYPLEGKHQMVACDQCHPRPATDGGLTPIVFHDTPTQCAQCHQDPHAGQLEGACTGCHDEQGWDTWQRIFTHSTHTDFPLDGIHADKKCFECHRRAPVQTYRPLPKTCDGCHQDISDAMAGLAFSIRAKQDPHAGRVACIQCHDSDQSEQTPVEFARRCRDCHNSHYAGLFFSWVRTFQTRRLNAGTILDNMCSNNSGECSDYESTYRTAGQVEFHNIELARRLYDLLLDDPEGTVQAKNKWR